MAAIYTPHFVKALLHSIKNALGIKAAKPENPQLHQAFFYGKSSGIQAQIFAVDCQEIAMDFTMAHPQNMDFTADGLQQVVGLGLKPPDQPNANASGLSSSNGLSRMSWPARADDSDLPDASMPEASMPDASVEDEVLEETRRQLCNVGDQPGVVQALAEVEAFKKTDDGELALAPNLRREVHCVHRNIGHPGLDIFVRALQNAGVQDHIVQWTKRYFRCPTCDALPRPNPARPGHLMRALEFNTVVGIDLCFWS